MIRGVVIGMFLFFAGTMSAYADDAPGADTGMTKILVTFSDPGMRNATRAGPAGPGYRRRLSIYLASIGVKRKANRIANDFNLVTLDEWPIVSLKVHCLVFGVAREVQVEDLLVRLRQRPEVESAQRLNEFEVTGTIGRGNDDPYVNLQRNLDTLELIQAHSWSLGDGSNVTIIDTGADFEHPELKSQIASHYDFVKNNDSDFSADAHGTAVAGVIGAAANNGVGMIGVAPSARLSVLKACWYKQDKTPAICNSFTLAKALSYAIDADTDIINLSLGGPSDELLGRLVRQAIDRGIVVVAAAPGQTEAGFPTGVSGVIVVGSIDQADSRTIARQLSINAPGEDILVPVPHGGYDYASGSSLSAAHVSGIVALLVARRPNLTNQQINTLLLASRPAIDESVNACRALAELLHESGCRIREAVSQRR
jgi:subtilisin family serine protease